MNRMRARLLALLLVSGLAGCGGGAAAHSIRLALDGPPLAVAMRGERTTWSGSMDRNCMAGVGAVTVHNAAGTTCSGVMDHPANDKGRLHADLACSNGETVSLVFRNLGPDQGMGLARINKTGEVAALFYHPSADEARRRLEGVMADIAAAREEKRQREIAPEDIH